MDELADCAREVLCGQVVGAVEVFEVSESVAFGGYDMECCGEGISLSVIVGEGHFVFEKARTWVGCMYKV